MRPVAITTAVMLLGVFASTTASQTQSLPQAPEPPRHLPASDLASAPNILRQDKAQHRNILRDNSPRDKTAPATESGKNTSPQPLPFSNTESRRPESWHQPAATADKPAPVKIVTAPPQARPAVAVMASDGVQPLSGPRTRVEAAPPVVMQTNYDTAPKQQTNNINIPQAKTENHRQPRPIDAANDLADGLEKLSPSQKQPNIIFPAPSGKSEDHSQAQPVNPAPDLSTGSKELAQPRKSRTANMKLGQNRKDQKQEKDYDPPGSLSSLVTIGGSLALVIGLFLIVAFFMRRATPAANLPLPDEVVEILGRAPLANRQQVHLMRCGNKLLLVCVTPNGTETLTEITEPAEVDRLAALCRSNSSKSSSANFRQVFEQLSWDNEPSKSKGGHA